MSAVFLIGFRGAGKTSLGECLARELGWEFRDLDQEWERDHGEKIESFVQRRGLPAFRETEQVFLQRAELDARDHASPFPLVIATGGGVVDWSASLAIMAESKIPKIWLYLPPEEVWRRLQSDSRRLEVGNLKDFSALERCWRERQPLYAKIATYTVPSQDINEALIQVKTLISKLGAN
jgi:shikimate kinase